MVACLLAVCILFNTAVVFADSNVYNLDYSSFVSKFNELVPNDYTLVYSLDSIIDYLWNNYDGTGNIDTLVFNFNDYVPSGNYIYTGSATTTMLRLTALICDNVYPIANYNNNNGLYSGYYRSYYTGNSYYDISSSGAGVKSSIDVIYFPTGSFFYDNEGNKYVNAYGGEEWTIINIAYPNTRANNTYMTDTGYNLLNDLSASILWDTANTADFDTNIAGGLREGYFFTEQPHFAVEAVVMDPLDLDSVQWRVSQINWSRYRKENGKYYDTSRSGGYSTTPLLYPDTNWKAYRDSTGLVIDKSIPLVIREGAILTDTTNKKIYVNDKSLPVTNTPLKVPVENIYSLLQSWLKFDIKSWASIYTALNGIQAQIDNIQDLIAASYFELSGFQDPYMGSYFDSLHNYITGAAESIGFNYDWINNPFQLYDNIPIVDTLNHFYLMTHTFTESGTMLTPTYQYKGETFTNSVYWIYRDIANISNNSNYTQTSLDTIIDKMDDLFPVVPDINPTIINTVGDNTNPISFKPSSVIEAHEEMQDALQFFSFDRPSGSLLSIFSDPDRWGFFSQENLIDCGISIENGD